MCGLRVQSLGHFWTDDGKTKEKKEPGAAKLNQFQADESSPVLGKILIRSAPSVDRVEQECSAGSCSSDAGGANTFQKIISKRYADISFGTSTHYLVLF